MPPVTTRPDDRRRPERVASRVREELTATLQRDLTDPRLSELVLSRVHATDDLGTVHVGVVIIGDDAKQSRAIEAVKVLSKLEGGLRKRLAPRLGMRRVPSLKFEVDGGRTEVEKLDRLLDEVGRELKGRKE